MSFPSGMSYLRYECHALSSMHLHSTQAFNVLARLKFGADLLRLQVVERFKVLGKSVDLRGVDPALSPVADHF